MVMASFSDLPPVVRTTSVRPMAPGHVQGAVDGRGVGLVGEGFDQTGRAQDGDAAQDAQPGIQGAPGHFFSVPDRDDYRDPEGIGVRVRPRSRPDADRGRIISLGVGLMAASPTGTGRPGRVTRPTPRPPSISIVSPVVLSGQQGHPGRYGGPVGDVRIVAGILDHRGRGPPGPTGVEPLLTGTTRWSP